MLDYVRYYFSKEGQENANREWKYNSSIEHKRKEEEMKEANRIWAQPKENPWNSILIKLKTLYGKYKSA